MSRRMLGLSLLIALVLGGLFLFASPRFDKPDDSALAMTFAGTAISLRPEAYTAALHVWVGKILVGLFSQMPRVPWYTLALLLCQYFFYVTAAYVIAHRRLPLLKLLFFFLYLIVVQATIWLHPSYTSSAFYLSAAGILLILHAELEDLACTVRWKYHLAGLLLIFAGSLFRWNASLLAVIELVPLWAIAGGANLKKHCRGLLLLATVSLVGIYGLYRVDLQYYKKDPHWANYNEICGLLYEFHDYGTIPHGSKTDSLFEKAGWSAAAKHLLYYNFIDGKRLGSIDSMKELLAKIPSRPKLSWEMTHDLTVMVLSRRVIWYAIVFWCVTLVFFSLPLRTLLGWGAFSAWVTGIVFTVASFLKFSAPVAIPPLLALPVLFLLFVGEPRAWFGGKSKLGWVLSGVAVLLCLFRLRAYHGLDFEDNRVATQMTEAFGRIPVGPEDLLIGWTTMDLDRLSAFADLRAFFGDRKMVGVGGIGVQLPFQGEILERYGIGDIYQALTEKKNLILLSSDKNVEFLRIYLKEALGRDTVFSPLMQSPHFTAYRLVSASP